MEPIRLERDALPPFLLERRDFLKRVSAGALVLPGFAGPFGRLVGQQAGKDSGGVVGDGVTSPDHFVPVDKKLDPAWVKALYAKGERTIRRGETRAACAMPCGGIGCGQLYVGGDGTLRTWQIFNQHVFSGYGEKNYDAGPPKRVVEQGFAIVVGRAGGTPLVRRLREEDVPDVEFLGEYPVATITYPAKVASGVGASEGSGFPIAAKLEVFSPFIPLDAESSTLPVTFFRVTLRNAGAAPVSGSLVGWLENAAAPVTGDAFGGERTQRVTSGVFGTLLECRIDPPADGAKEQAPPELFADFEGDGYGAWKVEGVAFGAGPSHGTEPNQNSVTGFEGKGLVNSYRPDDAPTGTLTSPPFVIRRPYVNFKIGGGNHPKENCLDLLIDGQVVATATGKNSEALEWAHFDVAAHVGKSAILQIVDRNSAGWGHVNVDQIEFADVARIGDGGPLTSQRDYGQLGLLVLDRPGGSDAAATASSPTFESSVRPTLAATRPIASTELSVDLAPGGERTFTFALLWYFPNHPQGRWYASRIASIGELAAYVASEKKRLITDTLAWRDAFYGGSLPHWLLERLHAPVANLATDTTQVWKNGRFWAWEGVGCCEGTCTHVWNYEHALARLFPSLSRSNREMQDLGEAFHEDGLVGFRGNDAYAADGQCGTVLKCFREHLMSADDSFLKRNWPRIKKVMEYSLKRDGDDDGVIEDSQHNTYDVAFFGPNTFVGSLYLAALRAAEEMAKRMGDAEFATRCRKVFESGRRLTVERLWNGEYFVQKVDLKKYPKWQYAEGCLADQLFGEGWLRQLGLGGIWPREITSRALRSIWNYCWAPDVGPQTARHQPDRYFARQGEAGLFVCTWPKTAHLGRESVPYRDEVWTGIEYQVAGHMIWEGMLEEGLSIIRAIDERYDGRKHNPWNEIECGDHYARALASWGCYLALMGFEYDGPAGGIGFAPRMQQDAIASAFTSADGWGTFAQFRSSTTQSNVVAVQRGGLRLRELRVELPDDSASWTVDVSHQVAAERPTSRVLAANLQREGRRAILRLAEPLDLAAGTVLQVRFRRA